MKTYVTYHTHCNDMPRRIASALRDFYVHLSALKFFSCVDLFYSVAEVTAANYLHWPRDILVVHSRHRCIETRQKILCLPTQTTS